MDTKLFNTTKSRGRALKATDTVNEAGGKAYSRKDEEALAQLVVCGALGNTFYVTAESQVDSIVELANKCSAMYVAQLAVYARQNGFMKDTPALLVATLAARKTDEATKLVEKVFPLVIDNGKMLRNFVQVIRSGKLGRKSFGSAIKRTIATWLANRKDEALFRDSVGETPSLSDVIKMVHPKASDKSRDALYGYLTGRVGFTADEFAALPEKDRRYAFCKTNLPAIVQQYEAYKVTKTGEVPDVEFRLLTALNLGTAEWTQIARKAPWHMARMNLNTFARHGVFDDAKMATVIADKLKDAETIRKVKVFPYQLMQAYLSTDSTTNVPEKVRNALQDAMEIAVTNVPVYAGNVFVCPDVSGSMSSPVTGYRAGATTSARYIDIAALVSAAVLRQNPEAEVIPFETKVNLSCKLNGRDSIMTNATKLSRIGGGGTTVSAPLSELNRRKAQVDLCIIVSDNESWADRGYYGTATGTMSEWNQIVQRCPKAKLVLIDISPSSSAQVENREDVLRVGGWNDTVFEIINSFVKGELGGEHWVKSIKETSL